MLGEDPQLMEPYGIPCIAEIFDFLCSLMSVIDSDTSGQNYILNDEDLPQFALGLVNSAIELGGQSFSHHPKLLSLIQDELFRNLMQIWMPYNPIVLSMVCTTVLKLYHTLQRHIKLQLEAFFSFVIIRLTQGNFGASYQQQEIATEALVDFCHQAQFMPEMYTNFDCNISCSNTFENLVNLLSKSSLPVNCPLSANHILALEGLLAVIHSMEDRIDTMAVDSSKISTISEPSVYVPFWTLECENEKDPACLVEFLRRQKYIKRQLMLGADHFNKDPKKGFQFLQGIHLLPENLDPRSVAYFLRYATGLDKNVVGDFLGDHDGFCLQVLAEFTKTFDFSNMSLDAALRTFLEYFRLPGEAQKIGRILDAFAERYYEQCTDVLASKDAAFLLSYSVILLNTDQHNLQVKKRMTEEDFIRNLRAANGNEDFPREMLKELYRSVVRDEIRISYDSGAGVSEMTLSRWLDLVHRSQQIMPYISCESQSLFDHDMFTIMSGPSIAAISVVFDNAEDEDILNACMDGFLAIAKISSNYHREDIVDDLVVSLCKFTTLLNPISSFEDPIIAFAEDIKARMACITVFTIANRFGDYIHGGWRNILDCIFQLHKLNLLPARLVSDTIDDQEAASDLSQGKVPFGGHSTPLLATSGSKRRSAGLMSRFSQLLLLESEEHRSHPTEQEVAAHQVALQTVENCHVDSIFSDSKFLQADSLSQLAKALILAAGRVQKVHSSPEDEDMAVFGLDLLITITLNNRDRIMLLWQGIYDHLAGIVQISTVPGALVEKAVFGLLRICKRLLPYKEDLADELLRSLQLILKLDARVADVYYERITQEVLQLVRANAGHIRSPIGWRTISSLLSITARHPEAAGYGFEALHFIMHEGAHLTLANYVLWLDAAQAFAESRLGKVERSVQALDLLAESVNSLACWSELFSKETKPDTGSREDTAKVSEKIGQMWMRLILTLQKVCGDQREEVRNHAILSLQQCVLVADRIQVPYLIWADCFDQVIFVLLDDMLEIALRYSPKEFRGMDGTLQHALKFMSKVFLHFLDKLVLLPNFRALWLALLGRMEMYMKARIRGKCSEKLQESIPELLKNMLLIMHARGVLVYQSSALGDSLWELTWHHVHGISPGLQSELFPEQETQPLLEGKSSIDKTAAEDNAGVVVDSCNNAKSADRTVETDPSSAATVQASEPDTVIQNQAAQ
ncbi:hypothetical protein O6H91_01G064200 [Diphasiastrum complanatum]|nr:hypothetical protein O6H91_01G064200 [Diphasiastrum complanatum]